MRHRHGQRKLNRTSSHRVAMLRNVTNSLFTHEAIKTTLPKAKELRRVAERAAEEGSPALTTWEKDFVEGVTGRLEKYGSAFRDPGKGRLEEALSQRQSQIARVIEKKTRKPKASAPPAPDGEKKPDAPRPSEISFSVIISRATRVGLGSPTPEQCERIRLR